MSGGYPKPTLPTIQAMGIIPPYLTTSTKFNQQRNLLRFYQGFKHCYLTKLKQLKVVLVPLIELI